MIRSLYRLLSILGDLKAISRGPAPYGRRVIRKAGHRHFGRAMRSVIRP